MKELAEKIVKEYEKNFVTKENPSLGTEAEVRFYLAALKFLRK